MAEVRKFRSIRKQKNRRRKFAFHNYDQFIKLIQFDFRSGLFFKILIGYVSALAIFETIYNFLKKHSEYELVEFFSIYTKVYVLLPIGIVLVYIIYCPLWNFSYIYRRNFKDPFTIKNNSENNSAKKQLKNLLLTSLVLLIIQLSILVSPFLEIAHILPTCIENKELWFINFLIVIILLLNAITRWNFKKVIDKKSFRILSVLNVICICLWLIFYFVGTFDNHSKFQDSHNILFQLSKKNNEYNSLDTLYRVQKVIQKIENSIDTISWKCSNETNILEYKLHYLSTSTDSISGFNDAGLKTKFLTPFIEICCEDNKTTYENNFESKTILHNPYMVHFVTSNSTRYDLTYAIEEIKSTFSWKVIDVINSFNKKMRNDVTFDSFDIQELTFTSNIYKTLLKKLNDEFIGKLDESNLSRADKLKTLVLAKNLFISNKIIIDRLANNVEETLKENLSTYVSSRSQLYFILQYSFFLFLLTLNMTYLTFAVFMKDEYQKQAFNFTKLTLILVFSCVIIIFIEDKLYTAKKADFIFGKHENTEEKVSDNIVAPSKTQINFTSFFGVK